MGSSVERARRFATRLSVRFAAGAALVVAVVAAVFASLVHGIESHESAADWSRHSQEVLAAASGYERVAVDLELCVRGYQLASAPEFRRAWRTTRRELGPAQRRLLSLLADNPAQTRRARAIAAAIARFIEEHALPAVAAAGQGPADAAALAASTRDGKRRLDAIRALFDDFETEETRLAAGRDAAVASERADVRGIAGVGIAAIVALLVLIALRLQRSVARPARAVAAAAALVAEGDLDARVRPGGTEELRRLADAFNTMAGSLGRAHVELEAHNEELEAQNLELVDQRWSLELALQRAASLALERERFDGIRRAVLEATVEGIALVGDDGHMDLCNPAMDALLADRELGERLLAVQADEAVVDELHDYDSGRTFQRYAAPVTGLSGAVGRLIVVRDVSREHDAARAKEEFVATVSHELRTPLTSIVGYLEPVADGELGALNDEQSAFLDVVDRNAQRLLRIVNDLLFVARADAAVANRAAHRVELVDVVAESVASAQRTAREAGVDMSVTACARPPVVGDPQRLSQLVDNLVSNAVKFTPRGGRVDVRVAVVGEHAEIEVRDTGIGIPAADLPRLFERFFRSRNAVGAAIGGTGLGLSVARQIARAHSGDIAVESVEGSGTTFRVILPLAESDAYPREEAA
jgi:signal transduction histidine kinase/CHASE3 domain sensor protein